MESKPQTGDKEAKQGKSDKNVAPPIPPTESSEKKGSEKKPYVTRLRIADFDAAYWEDEEVFDFRRSSRVPPPRYFRHHVHPQKQHDQEAMEKRIKSALELAKLSKDDEWNEDGTTKSAADNHWKMDPSFIRYKGGCHCGAVRFEVFAPPTLKVIECNCSICTKKQNRHFIVPLNNFKLLKGHKALTTYSFNTHKAKHTFCSVCGVQPFYIPRSNSDGYGITVHCLDEGTYKKEKVEKFNGKQWEEEIKKKPHITNYSKAKV